MGKISCNWKFKDDLSKTNAAKDAFQLFENMLEKENLITRKGTIVDATFVDVPKQHNTHDENNDIKKGRIPEDWTKPENAAESKFITDFKVTDAAVHDSQCCTEMLDENDKILYADSAYSGKQIKESLPKNCKNMICEKGYRNHLLTKKQCKQNQIKSKIRCRIEHIFGYITNSMNGIFMRSIGMRRATFNIGIMNLVYNLCRFEIMTRKVRRPV